MIAAAASGVLTMLNAALLAGGLMMLAGCCTGSEAQRGIEWPVLIVIGAALGLGDALDRSGAASFIAEGLIGLAGGNPWLVLLIVVIVTSFFTELITNNAAAVLVFPISLSAVEAMNVNPTPFIVAIMVAASASFATPFGYQTNLMVYGPGGYRFADYLRIGIPQCADDDPWSPCWRRWSGGFEFRRFTGRETAAARCVQHCVPRHQPSLWHGQSAQRRRQD